MSIHMMVDCETLSTELNATILTLGAVKFNPFTNDPMQELYLKFNIEEQEAIGSHVDDKTLDWWAKQDPLIIEEAFDSYNRISIQDAMQQFHKFTWNCSKVWSHGATFDLIILQLLFKKLNMNVPWQYYDMRDTRSIFALGIDPNMPQAQKHNALEDAKRQAIGVRNVMQGLIKLGLTPKG